MKPSLTLPRWGQKDEEYQPGELVALVKLLRPALLVLLMIASVVVSALMVIWSAHQYRVLFNQQQELVQQWDELQVEWGQLLLEQGALAANSRVESVAIKRLGMRIPDQVEVIRDER